MNPIRGRGWLLTLALAVMMTATAAGAADSPDLQIGPYLQSVLQESAVVMWHSATSAPGRVEYGEGERMDRRAAETQEARIHEVRLTGLKPGTRYHYRVVWGDHSSDVYSFRTAPPAGTRRFRLALYGDNRSQPNVHREIVQRVMAERPELVLNTGDLVAAGRQVEQWEPMFFGPLRPLMREIGYWPSLGNHEQNADSYYHFFSLPNNEAWYSFDYANAHIVALDSNQPYTPGSPQYDWLEKDLRSSRADWKIVFFHHPMFSAHPTRSINANRWAWQPLFIRLGVNLVLTGHDHHYQRAHPVGSANGGGITYHFTSGGGGAGLYPVHQHIWTAVTESVHHYMVFDFDGRTTRGKAITAEGKQIDAFTIDLDRKPSPGEFVAWEPFMMERSLEESLRAGAPVGVKAGSFEVRAALPLENPLPAAIRAEVTWENPGGWQMEPARAEVRLRPGSAERVTFTARGRWPESYPVPGAVVRIVEGAEGFRNREIRLAPIRIRPERELAAAEGDAPLSVSPMIHTNGRERMADLAFAVCRTAAGLEVRARVPQPNAATLAVGETERDAGRMRGRDESLVIRLAPPGAARYELVVNSRGTLYDARDGDATWNGTWTAGVKPAEGGWEVNLRIPWADLGLSGPPAAGTRWPFNLARTDGSRRETGEWVPTFGDANAPGGYGVLRFP
jgi:hypothetical protein